MTALDTNLVVRLLVNDDPRQAARVVHLIQRERVFLPKTVLLECEWVLRHAYGLDRGVILGAFEKLLGLDHLTVEDGAAVEQALAWYAQGLDLADALHLASSQGASAFATFDLRLRRRARRLEAQPRVVAP
ncbi:MAG: type II toxin-antitoxin system VapC family toxin [Nitrospirae bacterium]|nr:MAG: type II toxin-antitoxin system VapC family toxin [Nitrospirota bacterium]